jgi:hypothetical protein
VQKLRKASGLAVTDAIDVWLAGAAPAAGAEGADAGVDVVARLWAALEAERAYVVAAVGGAPRPHAAGGAAGAELAREAHEVFGAAFEVVITRAGGAAGAAAALAAAELAAAALDDDDDDDDA